MSSTKTGFSRALLFSAGLCAAAATWAAGPTPGVNVTVTNPRSSPVPVAVTNPLQVTVTNPTMMQSVIVSNVAARFDTELTKGSSPTTLVPQDAIPAGQVLILTYANASGFPVDSRDVITAADCQINLVHTEEGHTLTGHLAALPVKASGLGSATASEPMYLPIRSGEGIALSCAASGTTSGTPVIMDSTWYVVLGGYFIDAR